MARAKICLLLAVEWFLKEGKTNGGNAEGLHLCGELRFGSEVVVVRLWMLDEMEYRVHERVIYLSIAASRISRMSPTCFEGPIDGMHNSRIVVATVHIDADKAFNRSMMRHCI